jgi:alkaline phosphatase D
MLPNNPAQTRVIVQVIGVAALAIYGSLRAPWAVAAEFRSEWPAGVERVWIGPEYWANRLQDWRLRDGRLECVETSPERPMRTVHLLVRALGAQQGSLEMSVETGPIESGGQPNGNAWVGFVIGAGGQDIDYRLTALVHHRPAANGGLLATLDGVGRVTFRDNEVGRTGGLLGPLTEQDLPELPAVPDQVPRFLEQMPPSIRLKLDAKPVGSTYSLTLAAYDSATDELIGMATLANVEPQKLDGNVALVSHLSPTGGQMGYWFCDWQVNGSKVVAHEERAFGPVLCAQHTLSGGVLKLTAQMGPLGKQDTNTARLQIRRGDDQAWHTVNEAQLDDLSYTFPFRVANWDSSENTQYRIVYDLKAGPDTVRRYAWQGLIRKEPTGRDTLTVAAFTGHRIFAGAPLRWDSGGIWFPHSELVAAVKHHRPDLLFFSGDQIYEGDLTGAQSSPLEKAMLDYLDKWYRWCWAFGELARDIPCVCIPDDHDVYHGNLWGAGGRKTDDIEEGGYRMPPEFVNMVQRTQTSHLPDPYDPTPVDQGIGVYYTAMNYAGLSFAIIEDRKWKSPPALLPAEAQVVNGWPQNPDFDPISQGDVPGARLLGERQLKFLRDWAADWSDGVWTKVVLSQSVFTNVATVPEEHPNDGAIAGLKPVPPGAIPKGYKLAIDADSNGWPQAGRNRALREMRRGFAFHINGDQHLGSVVHYGIDTWEDAGYSFCVPSTANVWPRRWYPPMPGEHRKPGSPAYTGRFRDGWGNCMTVHAVANPVLSGHEPAALYDRAPGYGIVRFHRETRDITIECWPRWVDPARPGAAQYPGWPITVNQLDNYGREAAAHLPTIAVTNMVDPVIEVIDEGDDQETVYTIRIRGTSFRPPVFKPGLYTVKVGEPGTPRMKTLKHLEATAGNDERVEVTP